MALGDPLLEDAESAAEKQMRSFSNHCFKILLENFTTQDDPGRAPFVFENQMIFPFDGLKRVEEASRERGVTFRENQHRDVYSWYPYVEGFSAGYVRDAIFRNTPVPRTIYDPFGGSGTTQLAASLLGIRSFYSEVNPFMSFVAETKINSAAWARKNIAIVSKGVERFKDGLTLRHLDRIGETLEHELARFEEAFPKRNFFDETHLRHLLAAKALAVEIGGDCFPLRDILLLACASNVVHSSHMTRRADLRRRRDDEYKTRVVNVPTAISASAAKMLQDIISLPLEMATTTRISEDCRVQDTQYQNAFDMVLTSPPYLNGTNYFRNTKLELWFLDLISSEAELVRFHKRAVVAGINSVSTSHPMPNRYDSVEEVASKLDACAPDRRIPLLVRQYVSDMHDVCASVYRALVPGGLVYLDIGDSKFYGVHVPTDRFLEEVGARVGFQVEHRHLLAKRYSRDKSDLVQVELVFKKPEHSPRTTAPHQKFTIEEKIVDFAAELPYKSGPYKSRSWGHRLHSLCSYQGKLKPSLAYWAIKQFVSKTGRVLDPLGGVGTVAFEAALSGRQAVSNDKSPLAATIAAAKLDPPTHDEAAAAIERLSANLAHVELNADDYQSATFGLNGCVKDYYHPDTLDEVLKARRCFKSFLASTKKNRADTFMWASLMHVLHGNRPYALSRMSHPIVPLFPKGDFVYKPLITHIERRMALSLKERLPTGFLPGRGLYGDFRELDPAQIGQFECILTSPPFMGMRFDRPNWLRLWFCGWGEDDFHKTSLSFLEREQTKSKLVYRDFFTVCHRLLMPGGITILHVGDDSRGGLVEALKQLGKERFVLRGDIIEDVQAIEQHGLSDKGNRTLTHHLIILQRS
jgi:DNA modification methylase